MKCNKRITILRIIFLTIMLFCTTKVNAASFSASSSTPKISKGKNGTITITANDCVGKFKITSSNSDVVSVEKDNVWIECGSESITLTANKAGSATITVKADDVASNSVDTIPVTGTKTIKITVPEEKNTTTTVSNPNTNTQKNDDSSNTTSNETTTNEPKFTDVNKTATVTAKVNFRSSYSTTSSALGKIKEGETVTLLANGDNGWSKIKYNNKTGYIKTEFLSLTDEGTETEDQEESEEAFGLDSLKIKDYELTPKFSTDIYEYTIKTTDKIKELEITQAVANVQTAKVEIKGNEKFKIGENTVTINVTDDASDKTAVYTITVKILEQEEVIEEEPNQTVFNEEIDRIQKDLNLRKWLIRGIIIFVTIIIIIMFILRYRTVKKEEAEDEYNKRDGYVIIDEKFDSQETDKEKIAKIEQFDEEIEKNNEKDIEPSIQPKRMKKSKGKHF